MSFSPNLTLFRRVVVELDWSIGNKTGNLEECISFTISSLHHSRVFFSTAHDSIKRAKTYLTGSGDDRTLTQGEVEEEYRVLVEYEE